MTTDKAMAEDILDRIVIRKKVEVQEAQRRFSLEALKENFDPSRVKRPFFETLGRPGAGGVNIIAEIKRASPSKGLISPDLDPAAQAAAYQKGGASAISVLTDRDFFKGSSEDLEAARNACSLPILRKDFLVSEYQLFESRAMKADAILLIARILSAGQLSEYLDLAVELDLDPLVEVHNETDVEKAAEAGAKLVGINNRNLRSFDTDISRATRIRSLLAGGQIAVAESGIGSRADVEENLKAGIFNFLIGESLVRAPDPAGFLAELMGQRPQ